METVWAKAWKYLTATLAFCASLLTPAACVQELSKDVTWLAFDEEGHGLRYQRNQIAYWQAMLDFVGKHLPVATQAGVAGSTPAASAP